LRVTVLGAGSFGTTIASLVSRRNETTLWARSPDVAEEVTSRRTNSTYLPGFELCPDLRATSDLAAAVRGAEVLVVAIPSHGFRDVLAETVPWVHPWIPVVSLTKGFEIGTRLRMTEVIEELLPGHPAAALAGPNLAKEIMAGQAAASVIATRDLTVAASLQQVLQTGLFRIYRNHDVVGCEVGAALKNVIAIGAGIAQGVGVGDNTRAAVVARGLAELTRIGVAMGGEPATFAGLTGLGDLVATCMSPLSRNRMVGEQLGLGRRTEDIVAEMATVAEGIKTARTAVELAEQYGVEAPICRQVDQVVRGEISGRDSYRGLVVQPGHEAEPG
jgi:glycerol-3-phosphate dehydrogenase (NAD(P)+)